jgi:hypothetical protein
MEGVQGIPNGSRLELGIREAGVTGMLDLGIKEARVTGFRFRPLCICVIGVLALQEKPIKPCIFSVT